MEKVVIYSNKRKLASMALICLFLAAYGAFLINDPSVGRLAKVFGGYLGLPLFGSALVFSLYRLVKPVPSLILSKDGLFDNASAVSAGFLRWSEIADIRIYSFMDQKFLGIVPVDQQAVLNRFSPPKRWLMHINKALAGAPFNIPAATFTVSLEEMLAQIDKFRGKNMGSPSKFD